ncbi:MAG: cache domain-containing protein [Rhodocyclaceae bacterium]|nr:cache domain-containing protein [Rhodocyclaceae bacterium]
MSFRLAVITAVATLALGVVALEAIETLDELLHEERGRKVEEVVSVAHSVLGHFHRMQTDGLIGEDEAKRLAAETIGSMRYGDGNYLWINDMGPSMVMHPIKPELNGRSLKDIRDPAGKQLFVDFVKTVRAAGAGSVHYQWPKPGEDAPQPKIAYVQGFAPWGWIVGTGDYVSDLNALFWLHASHSLVLVSIGFLVVVLTAFVIGRNLVRQLGGEPAALSEAALRIADGDLRTPVALRKGDSSSVCFAMGRMQSDLTTMIGAVLAQVRNITEAVGSVTASTETLRQAAGTQASAAESTAAAIEQIAVSVAHVRDTSEQTRTTSEQTCRVAEQGESDSSAATRSIANVAETVEQAASQIQVLKERSSEIGSIAKVIGEIADQTNLLALNAAIEAARAGEQGRGFAVVADEVRKLAERTGTATAQISEVIASVQAETHSAVASIEAIVPRVQKGSELASGAADSLRSIQGSAAETLARLSDVANSMHELTSGANAIARNMEEIADMADRSGTAIESSAGVTETLAKSARELDQMVSRFRI